MDKIQLRSFKDINQVLASYIPAVREITGKDITLQRMEPLMRALGNPEQKLKIVHVAGTSGKTSTAYYIAALLQAAGNRVGLTVSPHIVCINERVQVDLEPLPEKLFCDELALFLEIIKDIEPQPTYFELLIGFVYWYFAKAGVDYAVIETGLGGLHDATNVAHQPDKVCVITDIGYDHVHVLGSTLTSIAAQKAGIIYPKNQVLMYKQADEIQSVFTEHCNKREAILNALSNIESPTEVVKQLPEFQRRNWLLAYQTYECLRGRDDLQQLIEPQLARTLSITVPGRMETHTIHEKTVVFDGAHNGQKMSAFVRSFQDKYPGKKAAILLSLKEGKDHETVLPLLGPICSQLIITAYDTSQDIPIKSMDSAVLAEAAQKHHFTNVSIEPDYKLAFQQLLLAQADMCIVTGSFYLLACLWPEIGRRV